MQNLPVPNTLRIVSRQSALALWQAEFVKTKLENYYPSLNITIQGVTTEGDKLLNSPLYNIGGKGLFVKELENALLDGTADIAVHSMKDVPAVLPTGLEIAAILTREDPRDALVSSKYSRVKHLPPNALVGTSSLRRQSQLLALRSDIRVSPLRGNVDSRVKKLDDEEYDAIILAVAGLKRLTLEHRISEYLSTDIMLPSIGQGALGIECRIEDETTQSLLAPLKDDETSYCVLAERSMNALLDGGCQLPVAGLATLNKGGTLKLTGMVCSPDGLTILKATAESTSSAALELGKQVARDLLEQGARKIIELCKS